MAQLGPAAGDVKALQARGRRFPGEDLGPGALIDGVVDGYDGGHEVGGGREVLAGKGGEELGFGGVDPVVIVEGFCCRRRMRK